MMSGIMAWLSVTFYVIKQATLKRGRGILVTRIHVCHYVVRDFKKRQTENLRFEFCKN